MSAQICIQATFIGFSVLPLHMCITITTKEKEFMDSRGSKEGTWEEMKEG